MIGSEITGRIGIHKVALCFLEKFGWLEREQPVGDHGIDAQVEIVEDGNPTGLLFGVQVKTGSSYVKTNQTCITHYVDERHVHYWLDHALPVLLVICDPELDIMYWEFVTSKNVARTEKGWKLDIPRDNRLGDRSSINKIRGRYFSSRNFTIMESGIDTSHALSRRISMKIVLKRETPSVVIEDQLPMLVEGLKQSDYYRSSIVEDHFRDQLADCVWIWFYRDFDQYQNGLPFCTAFWNHPDSRSPTELPSYDKEINGIYVRYAPTEIPDEFVNRRLSKGKYLKVVDCFLSETKGIYEGIAEVYSKYQDGGDATSLKRQLLEFRSQAGGLLPDDYQSSFPPLECSDLDQIVQNMNAAIENIFIVVSGAERDDPNIHDCIEMYLKEYAKNIESAAHERRKVT
jgi:uncharacterized protein DUF4365